MIQGVEQVWQMSQSTVNDPVLINLFHMGVLDWTGPNTHLHQATQAIQHSTTMHLCAFPWILTLEAKVRYWFWVF